MKLYVEGNINRYYVQTLCMIFFPGEKFPEDEEITENTPSLSLKLICDDERAIARVEAKKGEKCVKAERDYLFADRPSEERTRKLAVGAAVIAALSELVKYKPSWGMLVGVRPSKVAMEMLNSGMSKSKVKRTLVGDFLVTPKKAGLAVDVARKEKEIIGTPSPKDCSVYISIPFCPTRCAYCSFVSYTSKRLLSLIPEYVDRLCDDVRNIFNTIKNLGLNVKTVYIGGGTPTILSEEQLIKLFSTISAGCDVSKLEEYTFEGGRPDTITAEKLRIAKEFGVNRISVNTQSLSDEVLREIGREHSADDFFRAYNIAAESGIQYINTDLITGLPKDKFSTFSETMDKILELRPHNITVHTFCVKKSADILKRDSHIYSITGGDVGKCVDYAQLKASQAGYNPYYMYRQKNTVGNFENVGFALEGAEGLYNVYMMEEVHSILAAGAGAVTKLVDYNSDKNGKIDIDRVFNAKYPYEYLSENESEKINKAITDYYIQKNF
jgi:oxygen-independent coproporphyrinogen-3 oxidase